MFLGKYLNPSMYLLKILPLLDCKDLALRSRGKGKLLWFLNQQPRVFYFRAPEGKWLQRVTPPSLETTVNEGLRTEINNPYGSLSQTS